MEPIFREQKNQSLFEKNGFVKVPLLSEAQVDELVTFFNHTRERHATVADLHHTTTDTKDKTLILEVDTQLKSVFVPALENVLMDFKPLAATFHIKEPGPGSATGIHQDPTFVDETHYYSANVWVALHDIDTHNGNLYFVSGSNHAVRSLRSIPSFPSYYDSFRQQLPEMAVQVPLKKGEAVIFSNGTIHGATENTTDSVRLAATLLVCSQPADWLLYYRDEKRPDGQLEKYHLDLESFITMAKGEKPSTETFRGAVPYEFPQISHGDFVRRVNGERPGYLQRIKRQTYRMKPLFKDAERQQAFERDGYVKIPLLTQEQVTLLVDAYAPVAAQHEAIGIPYITTSHSNDAELITRVDDSLRQVLAPAMDVFLQNHNLLFGNYLLKMPVSGSETDPHQDITFVDEANYASVNVWVALQDTDETNGCMYFLPGSHTRIPTLRPTHSYPWAYEHVKNEIRNRSQVYTAKAGEAFVFHHAVVHGSFANRSGKPRLAAVMAAYHSEAPLLHYYLPQGKGNDVQQYGMTKEAFLSFVKNNPPAKGTFLGTVQHDFHQLSLTEFEALYSVQPQKKSFRQVLSGLFHKTPTS